VGVGGTCANNLHAANISRRINNATQQRHLMSVSAAAECRR